MKNKVSKHIGWLGLILFYTGVVRIHKDGDGFREVHRAWHPVYWILVIALIPLCAVAGEKLFWVLPYKLTDFWVKNIDQLQWVYPWTNVDSLKPFRSPGKK